MTTVAAIADKALAAVALEVTDAIITTTLYEPTHGVYSAVTATNADGETNHGTVQMVIQTEAPKPDDFPDYIVGAGDQLAFIRGNVVPQEGWELRGAQNYVIRAVQDILGNGTIFNVVIR